MVCHKISMCQCAASCCLLDLKRFQDDFSFLKTCELTSIKRLCCQNMMWLIAWLSAKECSLFANTVPRTKTSSVGILIDVQMFETRLRVWWLKIGQCCTLTLATCRTCSRAPGIMVSIYSMCGEMCVCVGGGSFSCVTSYIWHSGTPTSSTLTVFKSVTFVAHIDTFYVPFF